VPAASSTSIRAVVVLCLVVALAADASADSAPYRTVEKLSVENESLRFSQILAPEAEESVGGGPDVPGNPFSRRDRPIFVELRERASGELVFRRYAPNLSHLWIGPDSRYFVGLSHVKYDNRVQLVVYDREGGLVHSEHISASGACLSTEAWSEFQRRYREAADHALSERRMVRDGYFVDFEDMGPKRLGDDAWDYLHQHRCPSPYSNRFHGSVTNYVFWFDREDPGLELVYGDGVTPLGLLIREPEWKSCDRNMSENEARCNRSTRRFFVRFRSRGH